MLSQISPIIPNACNSDGSEFQELTDQIKVLVTLQGNRDVRLLEQAEIQLTLFERIQNRLDEVDRRLEEIARIHTDPTPSQQAQPTNEPANSFMPGWQDQREQMLRSLVDQEELNNSNKSPVRGAQSQDVDLSTAKSLVELDPFQTPFDASPEDLNEIESLKKQLNNAIREIELECSVLRAKLCQEKQRLEEKETAIAHREKNLGRQSGLGNVSNQTNDGWLFSRLKGLLGRS